MYHELIFESAECVFGKKGFDGATMQDIADEAGVSLKTLYATYESKRDLYAEVMQERATAFVSAIRAALDDTAEPLERLERAASAYVAFLFEHEDWLRIHLRTRVAWAFRPDDEEAAAIWQEGHAAYARVLREGMDLGIFQPGDPEDLAVLTQTVMQVQVARAVARGEDDPALVSDGIGVLLRRLLGAVG